MLSGELFHATLLPGDDDHSVAAGFGVAHRAGERVEASRIRVHAGPAEICQRAHARWRLAHRVEAGSRVERFRERRDVDQPGPRAERQLAALLLLHQKCGDLLRVSLGDPHEPLSATGVQHESVADVVEQRRRPAPSEVRKEQVDALVVRAVGEVAAVALPRLAHIVATGGEVEGLDHGECGAHGLGTAIQLSGRPHLHRGHLRHRLLRVHVELAQVVDLVAEPLGTPGTRAVESVDIDDSPSHCKVTGHRHGGFTAVPERDEAREKRVARRARTPRDLGDAVADELRRQRGSQQGLR